MTANLTVYSSVNPRLAGLLALKGHKAVGGMRASIYNAMPFGRRAGIDGFHERLRKTPWLNVEVS
jgi:hypothetical protein